MCTPDLGVAGVWAPQLGGVTVWALQFHTAASHFIGIIGLASCLVRAIGYALQWGRVSGVASCLGEANSFALPLGWIAGWEAKAGRTANHAPWQDRDTRSAP